MSDTVHTADRDGARKAAGPETGAHTPGPWEVGTHNRHIKVQYQPIFVRIGNRELRIADFASDEWDANALLIAAAPALLNAAAELDAWWTKDYPDGPDGHSILSEDTREIWRNIRAAIRRATGETP